MEKIDRKVNDKAPKSLIIKCPFILENKSIKNETAIKIWLIIISDHINTNIVDW